MKTFQVFFVILALGVFLPAESHRILAIFPFCGRSHQMMFDALIKGLTKRGHQVDIVTCFPPKKPISNLTVLMNVQDTQARNVNNWEWNRALNVGTDTLKVIAGQYGNELCKMMARPEMQKLIKNPPKDPPYDLLITEAFGANCFIGFGALLKVPVVLTSTTIEFPWIDRALGNPTNTAFFPSFLAEYIHPMSFWTRLQNTVHDALSTHRYYKMTGDIQNELMRKYLGSDIPDIRELEKNVTLALVNSYFTLTGVRPTTTGLIEVGGLHVEDNYAELSPDLKKWLDESKDGVIYFTLGSMVNIETMPDETVEDLYNVFKRIAPVRVLMKVANKEKLLPGLPKNVLTSSWIPQVPVLAHNNTRLFITHGGLMSTQESLYHGVPVIGIPLFGDQQLNMQYYVRNGMGIKLDFDNINERTVFTAIDDVLNNPSYRNAAKFQSALFRDRPMSALDTAIYWVEYAIRNDHKVLRSPAIDLTWWQLLLLDVYAFLLISAIVTVCVLLLIIKFFAKAISEMISPSKPSTKQGKRD